MGKQFTRSTPSYFSSGADLASRLRTVIDSKCEGFMDLLAAIKREERTLEKELAKLQGKLNGVRAAAKALGTKARREVTEVKKRVMSAAARAKISKATRARWARFRAQAKKATKS